MHCHGWHHPLIPTAVLAASLVGSAHCALMCGGLVAATARTAKEQAAYHLARLAGYAALGALFGWIGRGLTRRLPDGVSEVVALVLAAGLVAAGLMMWRGGRPIHLPGYGLVNRVLTAVMRRTLSGSGKGGLAGPGIVGLLSVFLPCGWLYGFVAASVTAADPFKAAVLMTCFWLGTIPALALSGSVMRRLISRSAGWTPKLSAALLMFAGLAPIVWRWVGPR